MKSKLGPTDSESGDLIAIVDTPKGSRNKYKFDEAFGLFKLTGVMPAGNVFPFDFGYIPGTLGEDGDPLDVLILLDEPVFVGCVVICRLLGVIEAEQTEKDGKTSRNDRLIAVAVKSHTLNHLESIDQINTNLVDEIEHYFVSYNQIRGKEFKPMGRFGPERARELVDAGSELFQKKPQGDES
jgi:inorganic pyrophosphatase